jgi:hypothetical protein
MDVGYTVGMGGFKAWMWGIMERGEACRVLYLDISRLNRGLLLEHYWKERDQLPSLLVCCQ